jgi:hypothetical protein
MIEFSAQINDPHCAPSLVQAAVARTLFPGCDNDNAAPSSETFDDGGLQLVVALRDYDEATRVPK